MTTEKDTPKEPTVKVKLVRATWDGDERKDAGTVIAMPVVAALWAVKNGLVEPDGDNPFIKA